MKTSESINEIAGALCKAQAAFPKLLKDQTAKIESSKGGYAYKYSDLGALFEAIRKPLTDNGLSVVQPIVTENGHHELVTLLLHTSGQFIEGRMRLADYERPQEFGSEITYYRRYALGALVGIASELDDDGAAAQAGRKIPNYYRGSPPKSTVAAEEIGNPNRRSAPTTDEEVERAWGVAAPPAQASPEPAKTLTEGVLTRENMAQAPPPDENRTFLLSRCKEKVEKDYKFVAKEREALKKQFLGGHAADMAKTDDLHKLYLFLGDKQAVADWRREFAA